VASMDSKERLLEIKLLRYASVEPFSDAARGNPGRRDYLLLVRCQTKVLREQSALILCEGRGTSMISSTKGEEREEAGRLNSPSAQSGEEKWLAGFRKGRLWTEQIPDPCVYTDRQPERS